jgi:SAM-dependent methyltransferase
MEASVADGRPTVADVLNAHHHWYHVIDLEPGASTPGWIDLRGHVEAPGLPKDLRGQRALDVGTFDGFWAFELERRGAEVVALDSDDMPPPDTPPIHRQRMVEQLAGMSTGTGFDLVKAHLGLRAQRISLNVYDLTAEAIGGPVDLAFVGAILLHLRDPVRALERIRHVLAPGGQVVVWEPVDLALADRGVPTARFHAFETPWTWWYPNPACLQQWLGTAGFTEITDHGMTPVVDGTGTTQMLCALHASP